MKLSNCWVLLIGLFLVIMTANGLYIRKIPSLTRPKSTLKMSLWKSKPVASINQVENVKSGIFSYFGKRSVSIENLDTVERNSIASKLTNIISSTGLLDPRNAEANEKKIVFIGFIGIIGCVSLIFKGLKKFGQLEDANVRRKQEIEREKAKRYKEDMYIDSVESMMTKLKQGKLKPSKRAQYIQDITGIDPAGAIRTFIEKGRVGERPNMDHLIKYAQKYSKPAQNQETSSANATELPTQQIPTMSPSASTTVSALLSKLSKSLRNGLGEADTNKLIKYLKDRLDSISDGKKLQAAITKIEERGDNLVYWQNYIRKL